MSFLLNLYEDGTLFVLDTLLRATCRNFIVYLSRTYLNLKKAFCGTSVEYLLKGFTVHLLIFIFLSIITFQCLVARNTFSISLACMGLQVFIAVFKFRIKNVFSRSFV